MSPVQREALGKAVSGAVSALWERSAGMGSGRDGADLTSRTQ